MIGLLSDKNAQTNDIQWNYAVMSWVNNVKNCVFLWCKIFGLNICVCVCIMVMVRWKCFGVSAMEWMGDGIIDPIYNMFSINDYQLLSNHSLNGKPIAIPSTTMENWRRKNIPFQHPKVHHCHCHFNLSRAAQVVPTWQPDCEKMEREWGNGDRFTLYISSFSL